MSEPSSAARRWVRAVDAWAEASSTYAGAATEVAISARDFADSVATHQDPNFRELGELAARLGSVIEEKATGPRDAYLGLSALRSEIADLFPEGS